MGVCERVNDHVNGAGKRDLNSIVHITRWVTEAAPCTICELGAALGKHWHEFYIVCVGVLWVKTAICDLILEVPVVQFLNNC